MRLCKINLKEDMARFRLVKILSRSNSITFSIVVLYCGRIGCPDELHTATYID
jgi:hypothetical protein